jgi:hypothetical protein
MSGWKSWAIGEVVEADDFQTYIQNQTVQNYPSSAARGSALGTAVAEGMVSYLADTNVVQVYDGSAWASIATGDITAVTAGTALTGGGTAGAVTLNVNQNALFTNGTSGLTMVSGGTAGVTYQPVSPNYIINGAFDIWQRGTAIAMSIPAFYADRWTAGFGGGAPTGTVSRQTFTPADITAIGFGDARFYNRFGVTTAGASTVADWRTRLEDVRTLAGQTATLSFWGRANSNKTELVRIDQFFDGSASATALSANINFTTVWQRFTITGTLPSVSGKTIGSNSYLDVVFRQTPADGYNLDLWGVQLEAGSVATPFKRNANSIQGELATCQRYYERVDGNGSFFGPGFVNSATLIYGVYTYKVEKRVTPSYSSSSATAVSAFSATTGTVTTTANSAANLSSTKVGVVQATVSGFTGGQGGMLGITTGSFIDFSAEL